MFAFVKDRSNDKIIDNMRLLTDDKYVKKIDK